MALADMIKRNSDDEASGKKLAEWIRTKVTEIRNSPGRLQQEAIWLTNAAYIKGWTNVVFDPVSKNFRNIDTGQRWMRRNRVSVNKILPLIQNRLSRLIKSRPKYVTRPNSNDSEDKEAARLSEMVLEMLWQKEGVSSKQIELFMGVQQAGHAYLKVSWDDMMGDQIMDPLNPDEVAFEGDVRVDVVPAFEVFPDPNAKSFEDLTYLIHAKVRPLTYFRGQYENGHDVKPEETWLLSLQNENRINTMNVASSGQLSPYMASKDSAVELVYYERRSKRHPQGRMVISANGVMLEDKPLPVGELPFAKFDDVVVCGSYYPESIITHMRPMQDQYNRIIRKRADWTNKLLTGKLLVPRGSEIIHEALNDQTEILNYTPVPNGPAPTYLQMPAIPQYGYKEEESMDALLNQISGINETSQGVASGGVTAAIGMALLTEQDQTRIGVVARRNELAMARFGKLLLKYVGEFYKTPRLLKIAGASLEYTVKSFQGMDLKGNYDVTVVEGSTLPESTTAKRDFILTLYQQGLLGNPQDPAAIQKVLKLIEFGDVGEIWEDFSLKMHQIKEDIEQIKQGIPPQVHEMDDHALHIYEKNKFRLTEAYKQMAMENQMLLEQNIEEHIRIDVEMANPQLAQQEKQLSEQEAELDQMSQMNAIGELEAVPPEVEAAEPPVIESMGEQII